MSWDRINIKQGQAIIAANDLESYERDMAILSAIKCKPVEFFEEKPRKWVLKEVAKTKWIDQMPSGKQGKPFRNGNYFYKFRVSPDQLSQSDFALLQKYGQHPIQDLHRILAILSTKYRIFLPKECKMDFEQRAELFLNKMPFGMAYAYCLFFSTYYPSLLAVGQAYSHGVQEAAEQFLKTQYSSG
jgi:hypothetical protein